MTDKKEILILIVDDEASARDTLADYLQECGFPVDTTDSGINAIEMLDQKRYGLIISDLLMPHMDGIELTKKIKSMGLQIPIIVITGYATIERAVESMKAGAFDFITKPFNFDHIKLTIDKAFETQRLVKMAHEREFYKKLSNCDELTGLANYRSFSDNLGKEIERGQRYDRSLTLMMIDIDDFKVCNDTHGHLAGDTVLRKISQLIIKNTRGSDFVARYGGEEFFVILPETSEMEASIVAERIREEVENFPFVSDKGTDMGTITVTIGISSMPERATTKKDLISTADAALYKGKASGKNRVVVYQQ